MPVLVVRVGERPAKPAGEGDKVEREERVVVLLLGVWVIDWERRETN